ncbi:MAG TPA: arginine decarboxylase, pyruvoyl-dependent [Candidatus Brocadiia bacterium]|nr:arginine decarboxylase, pyruvoyl-dependent [Candidatus Brocadiia bacterium]
MQNFVPRRIFFTKGVGRHKDKLQSFELALRKASIAEFNLVRVSSIFPPGCKIVQPADGLKNMAPGQIVFCVMADNATNEPHRMIASAIGLAVPAEGEQYGYLSEHHSFGENEEKAGDYAEDLAATMLATTLGIDFNPDKNYDERKEVYRMSGKIVRTRNICQTAKGDKKGIWTTTVAAAVFVSD